MKRKVMEINVLLIDDNAVTLRHLADHIEPVTTVTFDDEVITCTLHRIQPVFALANTSTVDLGGTLKKALALEPGVAVIDLKLEGDAGDDYSGADLSLRIKSVCNDCCIILVSHHFDAAPRLLDNLEIFRYRVDRNQAGYGEELRKRFTEAVRHHVSAITFRRLLNTPVAPRHLAKKLFSRAVYISYARDDQGNAGPSREDIVNRIERSLRTNGYDVRLDRTNLDYTGLISTFMNEIGRGGCVVAVLSEKYLRSPFCMYELLEVHRNQDFHQRVCPVVLPDALVTDFAHRLSCIDYWSELFEEFQELFQKIKPGVLPVEELGELHRYRDISQGVGRLLSFIADMNYSTPEELEKDDFAILRNRIDQCLE